jgi:MYXO-CTERM domain-containing protein
LALVLSGSLIAGTSANATVVNLADNWVAEWDNSLNGLVTIQFVDYIGGAIHIQKSAQFTQGPNGQGLYPAIPIVFRQIGASNVTHIVIDDEIITNQTGTTWTDFHMEVLDSGDASFNPDLTAASANGNGFSIAPFTQFAFSNNNMNLDIWGGQILNNQTWFPGDGGFDGELWINVNSHWNGSIGTVFTLKEIPTPTPGALALLGLAALGGRSRRRS